jgi:hypothetical protein
MTRSEIGSFAIQDLGRPELFDSHQGGVAPQQKELIAR